MTDHATLAKLFEAALKEPDPVPERKPRNILPHRNATAQVNAGKQSGNAASPARDTKSDPNKAG